MAQIAPVAGEGRLSRLSDRVAAEVRALRGRHSISQSQLGQLLGLSQPQVSARLRGRVEFSLSEIERLAEVFEVDPGDLLGYTAPAPARPIPSISPATRGTVEVTTHESRRRPGPRHLAARRRRRYALLSGGAPPRLALVTSGF